MPSEEPLSQDTFAILRMKTLATAETTNGAFELVEDTRGQGEGPALHVPKRSDEGFYVLDGSFTFTRGDEEISAGPGSFVMIPRGAAHRYQAQRDGSRVLILFRQPLDSMSFCSSWTVSSLPVSPAEKLWRPSKASTTPILPEPRHLPEESGADGYPQ